MSPTATCQECQRLFFGTTRLAASDAVWHHYIDEHLHRPAPDVIRQTDDVTWRAQALAAIRTLAESGQPFVISDVIAMGVGEAVSPRTDWPRITNEAADLGWIKPTGRLGHSKRPATKGSPVTEWIGTVQTQFGRRPA